MFRMEKVVTYIKQRRRQRLADSIVSNGERLRRYEVSRASVDAALYPHDTDYLDAEINRLTQRHNALLTKFKETV